MIGAEERARGYSRRHWERLIRTGYRTAFGAEPVAGASLYHAPAAVLCHMVGPDPRFVYANRTAQGLWERSWREFVGMPSRLTAPPEQRAERAEALQGNRVVTGYSGVRVSATGRLFHIHGAVLWPVPDDDGAVIGQAALFSRWTFLPEAKPISR